MYNFRLKKICLQLSLELSRSNDEQIEEVYSIISDEYKIRQNAKKQVAKNGENK